MQNNYSIKCFKIVMKALIAVYMIIFIANQSGYYSFTSKNKKELTELQIMKFEEDVKNGVNIDLDEYLANTNVSYENNLSRFGSNVSNFFGGLIEKGIYKSFSFLSDLVNI